MALHRPPLPAGTVVDVHVLAGDRLHVEAPDGMRLDIPAPDGRVRLWLPQTGVWTWEAGDYLVERVEVIPAPAPAAPEPETRPITRMTLDAWWCPFCARANATDVDVCPCGARRDQDEAVKAA